MYMKRAVLILAYGAPNALEDVEPFYTDIRRGNKPPPELLEELMGRYRAIGGSSPLLGITQRQANALAERMGSDVAPYIGMRHWTPWIKDTVAQMSRDGIDDAVVLVMAPHYSSMSIAKYRALVDDANQALSKPMRIRFINSWHTEPAFVSSLAQRVRQAFEHFSAEERERLTVLFTAHSLPEKSLKDGDPYSEQLLETSRLVADAAGIKNWRFAFQSAGRTRDPWLGPDILTVLDELASEKQSAALVCVVGFVADHLEVLYDIDVEAIPHASGLGIHLERIEMLNDDPVLIQGLANVAQRAFASMSPAL
ncbi:MAG: ferrochelatase [Kiritimatiellae bacterium]|nr:ferrochelatase [Kiritimatiellia bacterium]